MNSQYEAIQYATLTCNTCKTNWVYAVNQPVRPWFSIAGVRCPDCPVTMSENGDTLIFKEGARPVGKDDFAEPDGYMSRALCAAEQGLAARGKKHGFHAFNSKHEMYGVLMEEIRELEAAIHSNDLNHIDAEALDCANVLLHWLATRGKS